MMCSNKIIHTLDYFGDYQCTCLSYPGVLGCPGTICLQNEHWPLYVALRPVKYEGGPLPKAVWPIWTPVKRNVSYDLFTTDHRNGGMGLVELPPWSEYDSNIAGFSKNISFGLMQGVCIIPSYHVMSPSINIVVLRGCGYSKSSK